MSINSFTYNGVSSESLGLYVGGQKTFGAPQRDVTKVSIPGRNGDLVRDNGRFLNSEIAYNIVAMDGFKETAQNVRNWLMSAKGYKRLEDTYHPDHYRMARVSDVIDFETGAYNATGKAQILFDCMPQRFLKSGEEISDASMVKHTESGEILSFETVAEDDMTKVEVTLSPIQSLNGYDHPWAAGAGKNKWDLASRMVGQTTAGGNSSVYYFLNDGIVSISANTANDGRKMFSAQSLAAGTYTFSAQVSLSGSTDRNISYSARDMTNLTDIKSLSFIYNIVNGNRVGFSFTISATTNVAISFQPHKSGSGTLSFTDIQLESGSPATAYEPYSNICPISGWSAANVYRTGKNLYSREYSQYNVPVYATDGTAASYPDVAAFWIRVKPNTRYYCSTVANPNMFYLRWINCDANKGFISRPGGTYNSNAIPSYFDTPANTYWVEIAINQHSAGQIAQNDWEVCISETPTDYVPFGTSIAFSFGQTVYGGEIDAKAGTVTETWGNIASYAGETLTGEWISDRDVYTSGGTPTTGAQVVYELPSPQSISVTPQSLSTLIGTNNVWASEGTVEIEYTEPGVVENPTPFESKPLIRVYGSGTCTVTVNNQIITINNVTDFVDIDCETMNCYNGVVNKNADVVLGAQGFPVLPAGKTMIRTGGGTTKVEITPRWWEL